MSTTDPQDWKEVSAPPPRQRLREVEGEPYVSLLESALPSGGLGRYSILGTRPFLIFQSKGEYLTIRTAGGRRELVGNPLEAVASLLREYSLPRRPSPVPFRSGAVGYFAYDLGRLIEKLPSEATDDLGLPDVHLAFYDRIEAWDHQEGKAYLCEWDGSRPPVEAPPRERKEPVKYLPAGARSNFTRETYLQAIRKVKEAIRDGEIYQANLSQRFQVETSLAPVALYERLLDQNPSAFACYLDVGPFQVISSSPERFLELRGRAVETRPIKGTRRRGETPEEDERLSEELLASEKDAAELAMIVDVQRNDVGRCAEYGSVEVTGWKTLRTLPTVFHLEATVRATLREGCDVTDLVRASFPGGSITGAPKIRAMEILEGLEPTRRGVYTGAVGYIGFDGDADLNIAIRTLVLKDGIASFQAGGGIVADSDPEAEYQETLDKARALADSLGVSLSCLQST